jgi:SAM-dependent methyltransferase
MFLKSARYYDAICSTLGKDYQKEVDCILGIIRRNIGSMGDTLLDIACGTGGHLVYLKDHFRVEGLDISPRMLEIAREKLGIIPLHEADMVDFELGKAFDVLICLYGSIGYVKTVDRLDVALANMSDHLKPGGMIIIEPWIYPADFQAGLIGAVFVEEPHVKISRMNVSRRENDTAILDFHFLVADKSGVEHFTERHDIALFEHEEYLSAFRLAGLDVCFEPDGLDGRAVYVGRKHNT